MARYRHMHTHACEPSPMPSCHARCSLIPFVIAQALILAACSSTGEATTQARPEEAPPVESTGVEATAESPSAAATGGPVPMVAAAIPTFIISSAAVSANDATIDLSYAPQGIILASATATARLKLTVTHGEMTYAYDLPQDGTQIAVPVNMGDGAYQVCVMLNVSQNDYVEILSTGADVTLESQFSPFLVPNMFCFYQDGSACVGEGRAIAQQSENQGDLARRICEYVMATLDYDYDKAQACKDATGYVPNPDASIADRRGICFDYASLCAALFRSSGIPAKVVTGYIIPDRTYHAWTEAYVDGEWQAYGLSTESGTWSRLDVTAADSVDDPATVAGMVYETRYEY